jgi:WD40-like Beta Propeller Repeat
MRSELDGDADLFAADPRRGPIAALTATNTDEWVNPDGVAVSPDYRRLVYDARVLDLVTGKWTRTIGAPPWSPDGSMLSAHMDGAIWLVHVKGGKRRLLARVGSAEVDVIGWSSDGALFAYQSREDLYVVPTRGGELKHVGRADTFTPAWAPNDHRIAFTRRGAAGEALVVVDVDTGVAQTVFQGAEFVGGPEWSRNGKIAFTSSHDGALYVADPTRGVRIPVARGGHPGDSGYSWAPDGTQLAFTLAVRNSVYVAVARADGSGRRILGRGTGWFWSPDSRWLAFPVVGGIRVVRSEGPGGRTIQIAGGPSVFGWGIGRFLRRGRGPAEAPVYEIARGLKLDTAGEILELAASGLRAATVVGTTRTDCEHVLLWEANRRVLRSEPPSKCADALRPNPLGRLRFSGRSAVHWWTEWECGNTECTANHHVGLVPRRGRLLALRPLRGRTATDDGSTPRHLSCIVCRPEGKARSRAVSTAGLNVAIFGRAIHVSGDGRRVTFRPPGRGAVFAAATKSGVFYAYNLASGRRRGRVAFVPREHLFR